MRIIIIIFCLLPLINSAPSKSLDLSSSPPHKLTILHTNDIHAHFDQFNKYGNDCSPEEIRLNKCFGGVARISYLVDKIRSEQDNVLLMDAGDEFSGSLFYKFFKSDIITQWMNGVKYDLMTIGNHEFDDGVDFLGKFIKTLTFPVVSSNVELADALPLKDAGVKPYHIFPEYKLGVIGYITNTTQDISPQARGIRFYNPVGIVQHHVDELKSMGINRIVCVSHNGYEDDKYLAANTRGISLIVGGHSHSLLHNDQSLPDVVGTFPSPVKNLDNEITHVVQAHRYGDYLGRVDMEFDQEDKLISLQGDPILLDQIVPVDESLSLQVRDWKSIFQLRLNQVIGTLKEECDREVCINRECLLANLILKAGLAFARNLDSSVSFALFNEKGFRAGLRTGNVSIADIINVLPFGNTLVMISMTGREVRNLIESIVAGKSIETGKRHISMGHFYGLKYSFNSSLPEFHRLVSVYILNNSIDGGGDTYSDMDVMAEYRVVTVSYLSNGGDNFFNSTPAKIVDTGVPFDEVVDGYIRRYRTIDVAYEHSIEKVD